MSKQAVFEIQINGIKESISAVDSLNKSLDALEQRIDALAKKNVNVSAKVSGSNTKELKQEEALLKKIDQLHQKVADTERKEYQELLHAKEELKEYQTIAKAIAAEQNISSGVNNPNTMLGMKAQLHDIKAAMQIVDVDSDKFKQMQKQANDLNNKLKELESGYGQYGRNVGNYANGVAEGFEKVRVRVGDTIREFNSAREASKTLNNELKSMALNGKQDTEEYKKLNEAVKQVNSTLKDTSRSSMMMDNLLDTMQGITAIGTMGVSLSNLFGIEDKDYQESMNRLMALFALLKSIETLKLQWDSDDGWLFKPFKKLFSEFDEKIKPKAVEFGNSVGMAILKGYASVFNKTKSFADEFEKIFGEGDVDAIANAIIENRRKIFEKINKLREKEGAEPLNVNAKGIHNKAYEIFEAGGKEGLKEWYEQFKNIDRLQLAMHNIAKVATVAARGLKLFGQAVLGAFSGLLLMMLPELLNKIVNGVQNFVKSLDTQKRAVELAAESLKALNKQLEIKRELLSSSYLKGEISAEEYLRGIYQSQREALIAQNEELNKRAATLKRGTSGWDILNPFSKNRFNGTKNLEYTGNRINENGTTVGTGNILSLDNNDLQITVKNVEELTNAWNQCNEAIENGQDYFTRWDEGFKGWFNSLFATVNDTEKVMRGLGNVGLGDFIARFDELNKKFHYAEISAKDYATEIGRLKAEMNDNKMLNSVIMNLDKYIPDEGVRNAIQNIINELVRLNDAFNMTTPEQVHYWNQVRIDAMKDGLQKELAQIQENERYEIQQRAYTEEQKTLLEKKYERQRQNARDKANKDALSKAKEHGKKLKDAENELIALRIENMKEGLDKELAQIENERRLAIQKARESGTKSGDIIMQLNIKYDQKILDQKRKWAAEIIKIYEDMLARIEQVNKQTFEIEVETATQNTEMKQSEALRKSGYEMITPSTYDDTKALEAYYKKVMDIEKKYLDIQTEIQRESLDKQLDYTKAEEELRHRRATDPNDNEFLQQLRAGKITQEEYDKLIEDENTAHAARMNAIDKKYASDLKKLTEDNLQDTQDLYADYFDKIVNGVAEDRAKIDEVVSQPLITDNDGWGIVNVTKNRQRFKQALSQYEELKNGIIEKQKELKNALDTSGITAEDFAIEQKALDEEMKAIDNAVTNIKQSSMGLLGDFFQSIQQYVQAVGQAATSIIQSIGEINDAAFENQMEALDRQTEYYEKQLEKQKEITQKYADDIDDIESELSDSRGDRRQFLIDQLNSQMEAQRQSLAQEKQIEKEQERLDRRKKDLEYQNEMRKWEQSKLTAAINAALAISNAAVNNWPIPAIPMMALATAVGAAQIAAVMAAKPKKYAKGGLLDGPSHNQGGIRAGNVELEGNEYVVNKQTTMQNLPLMNFINSRKKRIDLDDIVEFYSNGIKKNVSISNKTKFADGGMLPTFRSDVDFEGNVLRAIEKYNERNVVVSVVDIINKSDNVKSVQALAGLS